VRYINNIRGRRNVSPAGEEETGRRVGVGRIGVGEKRIGGSASEVSLSTASSSKIRCDALHRSLNVFFENVLPHDSTKISETFVLSGLESGKELLAIHHVGLDKDDRTSVKTVRQ